MEQTSSKQKFLVKVMACQCRLEDLRRLSFLSVRLLLQPTSLSCVEAPFLQPGLPRYRAGLQQYVQLYELWSFLNRFA